MIDFNTAVKNEFLRFLYAIVIPGFTVSIFISYSLITNLIDPYNIFNDLSKSIIFVVSSIFFMLLCGFIIEIIGVYIESKFLDDQINNLDNRFNNTWDSYLNIDSKVTSSIIVVQYYRTILTKFKFLINFPISLIMSLIVIISNSILLDKPMINFCDKKNTYLFIIILFLTLLICYFSWRRAKYCAKLLHEYRIQILDKYLDIIKNTIPSEIKSNNLKVD